MKLQNVRKNEKECKDLRIFVTAFHKFVKISWVGSLTFGLFMNFFTTYSDLFVEGKSAT